MSKSEREKLKTLRDQDAVLAMREYEAENLAVVAKTARLRALRLAREAATPTEATVKPKTRALR
jgi:hypothetical protein